MPPCRVAPLTPRKLPRYHAGFVVEQTHNMAILAAAMLTLCVFANRDVSQFDSSGSYVGKLAHAENSRPSESTSQVERVSKHIMRDRGSPLPW